MNRQSTAVRGWGLLAALVAAALACSLPTPSGGGATSQEEEQTGGAEGAGEAATATLEPLEPLLAAPGVATITLLTPRQGAGEKPLLKWEPVSGAVRYGLVVYDADGGAYWSWQGEETSVYLGGTQDPPPEGSAGPVLGPGMSWGVMAFDAGGRLVASSGQSPLSP